MTTTETSALRKAVSQTIDEGRVGSPRFLRCIAHESEPAGLQNFLSELVSLAEGWFSSAPVQRYRMSDDAQTYVTEILKWPQGQGALLTVTSAPSNGTPDLDLMLVGSRGTLYHES